MWRGPKMAVGETQWSVKLDLFNECLHLFTEGDQRGRNLTSSGRLFPSREAATKMLGRLIVVLWRDDDPCDREKHRGDGFSENVRCNHCCACF